MANLKGAVCVDGCLHRWFLTELLKELARSNFFQNPEQKCFKRYSGIKSSKIKCYGSCFGFCSYHNTIYVHKRKWLEGEGSDQKLPLKT